MFHPVNDRLSVFLILFLLLFLLLPTLADGYFAALGSRSQREMFFNWIDSSIICRIQRYYTGSCASSIVFRCSLALASTHLLFRFRLPPFPVLSQKLHQLILILFRQQILQCAVSGVLTLPQPPKMDWLVLMPFDPVPNARNRWRRCCCCCCCCCCGGALMFLVRLLPSFYPPPL